jgi:hypothetical protein
MCIFLVFFQSHPLKPDLLVVYHPDSEMEGWDCFTEYTSEKIAISNNKLYRCAHVFCKYVCNVYFFLQRNEKNQQCTVRGRIEFAKIHLIIFIIMKLGSIRLYKIQYNGVT